MMASFFINGTNRVMNLDQILECSTSSSCKPTKDNPHLEVNFQSQ